MSPGSPMLPAAQPLQTRPLIPLPLQESDIEVAAMRWGVTEEDWPRYVELMKGEAGLHYPHLEPAAVLGIYAENDADRLRFGEVWHQRELARIKKLLDFQFSTRQLSSNDPPIDAARLTQLLQAAQANNPEPVGKEERLALFIGSDCAECDRLTRQLLQRGRALDIYMLDAADDQAIQAWAVEQNIPLERVRNREVTLNHDSGTLDWVSGGAVVRTPALYVQRVEGWAPITASDL